MRRRSRRWALPVLLAAVSLGCDGGVADTKDAAPLPPPRCEGEAGAATFQATAIWAREGTMGTELELVVTLHNPMGAAILFDSTSSPDFFSATTNGGDTEIRFRIVSPGNSVSVNFTVTCGTLSDQGTMSITWSPPPVEGRMENVVIVVGGA